MKMTVCSEPDCYRRTVQVMDIRQYCLDLWPKLSLHLLCPNGGAPLCVGRPFGKQVCQLKAKLTPGDCYDAVEGTLVDLIELPIPELGMQTQEPLENAALSV
ncbi:MAG: hypothetical protein ACXW5U_26840 [Thermoanaerobaculia bacterium]